MPHNDSFVRHHTKAHTRAQPHRDDFTIADHIDVESVHELHFLWVDWLWWWLVSLHKKENERCTTMSYIIRIIIKK